MTANIFIFFYMGLVLTALRAALIFTYGATLGVLFFSSSQIIKKILILELLSILRIFLALHLIYKTLISGDVLVILLTFLVIDAVLGLALIVSLRRKTSHYLKINQSYWLCS